MKYFLLLMFLVVSTLGCRTADYTKGKSDVCQVHHIKMAERRVPIHYGLPAYDENIKRSYELFPNGNTYALGGCCEMDEKRAWVYLCPQCEAGLKEFKKTNPVHR